MAAGQEVAQKLLSLWLEVAKSFELPVSTYMRKKVIKPDQGNVHVEGKVDDVSAERREVNIPWPKVFLGIALVATVAGALFATKTLAGIDKNIAAAKEAARPANIKITKITTPQCPDCFNVDDAIATLKKQNVSVGEEKAVAFDSSEGQSLIKQFRIERVPTYIVAGEVAKKSIEGFIKGNGEIKNGTFVFTKVNPIFLATDTKKEMGKVTATILTDPSCSQCLDPKLTVEAYKKAGIKITDQKEVVWNSLEGQQLISQYKITKVPTFLFSSDIDYYDSVKANWTRIGTVEQDKTYIARNLFLPYRDLDKGQILGLIDIIYLTDSTCLDCYDPIKVQKPILTQGFGVGFSSERTVDVNSGAGQSLKDKYKITKVPTILLSPGADEYAALKGVWKSVGTVETDGEYVFRDMTKIGSVTYKDLTSNQIIGQGQPTRTGTTHTPTQ